MGSSETNQETSRESSEKHSPQGTTPTIQAQEAVEVAGVSFAPVLDAAIPVEASSKNNGKAMTLSFYFNLALYSS